jgi:hypothetical protein
VAERVVDVLEPVEVEEEHRDRLATAGLARDGVLDPVGEQRAVRQPGELVVERPVGELVLERLALGDVAGVQDPALHLGVVQEVVADRLRVAPRPVRMPQAAGDHRHAARLGGDLLDEALQVRVVVGVDLVHEVLRAQLVRVVAVDVAHRVADVGDRAGPVEDEDHVRRVLHEHPEVPLAGGERRLRLLALGGHPRDPVGDEGEAEEAHAGQPVHVGGGDQARGDPRDDGGLPGEDRRRAPGEGATRGRCPRRLHGVGDQEAEPDDEARPPAGRVEQRGHRRDRECQPQVLLTRRARRRPQRVPDADRRGGQRRQRRERPDRPAAEESGGLQDRQGAQERQQLTHVPPQSTAHDVDPRLFHAEPR